LALNVLRHDVISTAMNRYAQWREMKKVHGKVEG